MNLPSLMGITLVVGLLLGLLGGGGSILLVPVLVYLVGLETKVAIATTLVVVGLTSLVAVVGHARAGRVCWKNGWAFGLAGMLGAYGGARLAAYVPGNVLLLMFAVIMLGTAFTMLIRRSEGPKTDTPGASCPTRLNLPGVLFDGFLVGIITGLVGVGGGFVIVPALNLLGGLPIRAAIGTSLLIIVMNSAAALAGYAGYVEIDLRFAGLVTAVAIVGSLIGSALTRYVSNSGLRRGFGLFVIAIAAYLLHRELSWKALADVERLVREHHEFFRGLLTAFLVMALYWTRGVIHYRHQRALDAAKDREPPLDWQI
jgi:uncharacterized membrane protein YfcA